MNRLRKGDEVIVLAGKSRGHKGKVLQVLRESDKVVVDGANIVRRHVKPNPAANKPGGIEDHQMPLHSSNVALLNPVTGKADRVGFKTLDDGRKVRYFKSNGEVVDA